MKKIKIGFIGYGKSTHRYHLPFIDYTNKYEVVGYYSEGSVEFDMPYTSELLNDITRFNNVEELLQSEVELIVINTPAKFHYSYAKQVIQASKNVLVEKPFCNTVVEAKELFELGRKFNVHVIPYQNRRFDSDFLTLKYVLDNNLVGEVMEIESNHTHYRTDGVNHSGDIYDGSIYGHAVHFIDQIISLFGRPDSVIYDIANQKQFYLGNGKMLGEDIPEDYYDIKLIYANMRVRVRFSQLIIKQPPRWIVNGTKATFEKYYIDQQERDLKNKIFPSDPNFALDTKDGIGTLYTLDDKISIPTIYGGYNLFYEEVYKLLNNQIDWVVSEEELLTNIEILETIVNNKTFK